jgi:L-seryl-tRNA(Ser) seleniumtransferase
VGTTNRTRVADYAAAVNERTALILRVHPSNFRIEGFTERASLEALVALGRRFDVAVVEDLGSGALLPLVASEPVVSASVGAGADVVCFSGDKLLGGPQAGILVGRTALVQKIRSHPLMRALRVDKLTYAVLEATLIEYLAGRAVHTVPVVRMVSLGAGQIETRARALAERIRAQGGWQVEIVDGRSTIGGGSAPGVELPTRLIALSRGTDRAEDIERFLRRGNPPIIARIHDDRVVIDLRTVAPEEDGVIAEGLKE